MQLTSLKMHFRTGRIAFTIPWWYDLPDQTNGGFRMKNLYRKNELTFALVWIAIYVAGTSLA